jgi:hexosaminidase
MWPASRHYAVDPMSDAAALSPDEQKLILGGESCQWAEWITPENIDSHIWPRNAVIAERLWSPQNVTDVDSMYVRMNAVSLDLEWLGLMHRSARYEMLHRMAGDADISSLRVLADVVEPVKGYSRWKDEQGPINFHAPLTRMIDAVDPESDTARQFAILVHTFLQSGGKDQTSEAQIRTWLMKWRDNDSNLHLLLTQSSLLQEDVSLSQNLSALGTAGLQALDYLDKSLAPPDSWKTQQLALVDQAKQRSADVLLMVAAPVQDLVTASASLHN